MIVRSCLGQSSSSISAAQVAGFNFRILTPVAIHHRTQNSFAHAAIVAFLSDSNALGGLGMGSDMGTLCIGMGMGMGSDILPDVYVVFGGLSS